VRIDGILPHPTNRTLFVQVTTNIISTPPIARRVVAVIETNRISTTPNVTRRIEAPGILRSRGADFTFNPSLHARPLSPSAGIPNRPSLDMQTAIQRFQTFFNNTGYKNDHYIYSVYCQPSSGNTDWVYSVNVSPLIYKEVESSQPGYREIWTTSFLVDMKGEVSMIETPSWFPKQSE
jgi:hypothetical protein